MAPLDVSGPTDQEDRSSPGGRPLVRPPARDEDPIMKELTGWPLGRHWLGTGPLAYDEDPPSWRG
jgi:hypothetical protein